MKTVWFLIFLLLSALAEAQAVNERLSVDATDAPRNILHSTVIVPVNSGAVTLMYPKWIPGNHRPNGPIHNVMGLHIKAGGKDVEWQPDLVDMYAFHVQPPTETRELESSVDTVTNNGKSSSATSK